MRVKIQIRKILSVIQQSQDSFFASAGSFNFLAFIVLYGSPKALYMLIIQPSLFQHLPAANKLDLVSKIMVLLWKGFMHKPFKSLMNPESTWDTEEPALKQTI